MNSIKFNTKNILLLSILFFLLLFLKRWNQLLSPEVWIEDGKYGITTFVHSGWNALFMEEGGFYKTINVFMTNTGMSISPLYYPEVSTYLAWVFTIFVALAVVYSPTVLRYRVLAAILIFFIPMDLENFGLPYYSFFWTGLLLFLTVLWEPGKRLFLRLFYILLGGLSSPIIFMLTPLQLYRVIVIKEHRRDEVISLLFVVATFLVQYQIFLKDGFTGSPMHVDIPFLLEYVRKFFGQYYLNFIAGNTVQTIGGFIVLLLFLAYWIQNYKDKYFYIVAALLLGTSFSAVLRKYIQIDPILHGGRYFFYPYIMLAWSLLYIAGAKQGWYKYIVAPILTLSFLISFYYPTRTHDKLSYKKYFIACSNPKNKINRIPEHMNGINIRFFFSLTSDECKRLLENDTLPIPEHLKVFQKDLHTMPEEKLPKEINYKLQLKLLNSSINSIKSFEKNSTKHNSTQKIVLPLDGLNNIAFKLAGEINNTQNLASAFVKIGDRIIFTDEDVNSKNHKFIFDEKIVYTDPMHDKSMKLLNKSTHFKLFTINKDGTAYYKVLDTLIVIPGIEDVLKKIPTTTKGFRFGLDRVAKSKDYIHIMGWFTQIDNNSIVKSPKTPVFVQIDDKFYLTTRKNREDVAKALNNSKYLHSGFSLYVPIKELNPGIHTVKLYGLSLDREKAFHPGKSWHFEISSDKKSVKFNKK